MSKESEWIRDKESELKCLDEVLSHMRTRPNADPVKNYEKQSHLQFYGNSDRGNNRSSFMSGKKEICGFKNK